MSARMIHSLENGETKLVRQEYSPDGEVRNYADPVHQLV